MLRLSLNGQSILGHWLWRGRCVRLRMALAGNLLVRLLLAILLLPWL